MRSLPELPEPVRETSHWLLVIGLAFFLADAASARLEQQLAVAPPPLPIALAKAISPTVGLAASPELARLLATTEPPASPTPSTTAPAGTPPQTVEATLPVTLVGSMAGPDGSGLGLFVVAGESRTACPGQSILDWTLTKVLPTAAVLSRNGEARTLELDEPLELATATRPATTVVTGTAPPAAPPAQDPPAAPTADSNLGIPTQGEVREQLDHHLADLIKQGSIKAVVRDQTVIGYGIKVKDPAFLLARIGLQTGDIVKSVNDTPCTGPSDMQKILKIVRNSRSLSFEVERGGQAITHRVDLPE